MGKVGGEPPRPVRWRSSDDTDDAAPKVNRDGAAPASEEPAAGSNAAAAEATAAAEGAEEDEAEAEEDEEDDPLTFTAKPADGVVIQSAVFERLQHGVSERCAGHRYAELPNALGH